MTSLPCLLLLNRSLLFKAVVLSSLELLQVLEHCDLVNKAIILSLPFTSLQTFNILLLCFHLALQPFHIPFYPSSSLHQYLPSVPTSYLAPFLAVVNFLTTRRNIFMLVSWDNERRIQGCGRVRDDSRTDRKEPFPFQLRRWYHRRNSPDFNFTLLPDEAARVWWENGQLFSQVHLQPR